MLTGSTTDSFTIVEIEVCHLKKCDLNDQQQSQAAPNWSSHLYIPNASHSDELAARNKLFSNDFMSFFLALINKLISYLLVSLIST